MHPITLRVPEEFDESLTEEAEAVGFASRAAYVRYLLQRHPERTGTDTESNTNRLDDLGVKATHPRRPPLTLRRARATLRIQTQISRIFAIVFGPSSPRTAHHTSARRRSTWSRSSRVRAKLATKELQNRLYEDCADDYSSARTFWNSISRYVEQVDGIEHPYGSWKYAPE